MRFSIITPCYNSTKTLLRTYNSLLRQQYNNFEWILVDDSSTDGGKTRALMEKIKSENKIEVKCVYLKKNYFSARSTIAGSEVATGNFVAILDHDDELIDNALLIVSQHLSDNNYAIYAGVCGRCLNEKKEIIGGRFPAKKIIANEGEIRFKYHFRGELFQFTRIDLIKKFFSKMKPGYTNGYVWALISKEENFIYVDEALRIYDTALLTSYSNNLQQTIRYPESKAEAIKETIAAYRNYLKYDLPYTFQLVASYLRHCINAKKSFLFAIKDFDWMLKVISLIVYPLSKAKSLGWF